MDGTFFQTRTQVKTDGAPQPRGTYSQAICVSNMVFLSGQLPLDPSTNQLVSGTPHDAYRQCFRNTRALCEAAGGTLDNIVKLMVYFVNPESASVLDDIMPEFFSEPYPARTRIVVKQLSLGALVELDGIMCL